MPGSLQPRSLQPGSLHADKLTTWFLKPQLTHSLPSKNLPALGARASLNTGVLPCETAHLCSLCPNPASCVAPPAPHPPYRAKSATGLRCSSSASTVQAPVDSQLPALWGHIAILERNEEGASIPTTQPLLSSEGRVRSCSGWIQVLLEQVRLWARQNLVMRVFMFLPHPISPHDHFLSQHPGRSIRVSPF